MPVEEQTQQSASMSMYTDNRVRLAQTLTIPNRKVTKLGFWMFKSIEPWNNIYFRIRAMNDAVLAAKLWGPAGDLTTIMTYYELEFDTPVVINEQCRICCEYDGGNSSYCVRVAYQGTDVKADEFMCRWTSPSWTDMATYDITYRYTYEEVAVGIVNKSANIAAQMVAAGLL